MKEIRRMNKEEIEVYEFLNQLEKYEIYPLARFLDIEWFIEIAYDREKGKKDKELFDIYYCEIAEEILNIMSERHYVINDLINGIEKEMLLIRIELLEDQVEELMAKK